MKGYLYSPFFDAFFLILPGFLGVFLYFFLMQFGITEMNPFLWFFVVLIADVGHVYSSLFRTYFHGEIRNKKRKLLFFVPMGSLFLLLFAASLGPAWFWRVMAYLAVFHFIRQQFGILKLFHSKRSCLPLLQKIEILGIYSFTIGPVLIWHLNGPYPFSWFLENDFLFFNLDLPEQPFNIFFFITWMVLIFIWVRNRDSFSWYRALFLFSTFVTWYGGIIWFKGDLSFTLTNCLAHGIPYYALIWKETKWIQKKGLIKGLFIFLGVLFSLAYIEEFFWDGIFWREHAGVFLGMSEKLPLGEGNIGLIFLAILSLPQVTHYVLDGFIWKREFRELINR